MRQPHLLSPQRLSPSPVLSPHFSPPCAAQGGSPWRWRHRRAFHPPLSSLRESDKGTLRKASPNLPFRLGGGGGGGGRSPDDRRSAADREKKGKEKEEEEGEGFSGALTGTLLAGAVLVGVVGGFGAAGLWHCWVRVVYTCLCRIGGSCNSSSTVDHVCRSIIR
uniref:Uncharacterized protein n=1 Tax=Triticum urartu TaxID=4572 RepID=A0A8R7PX33_TRIUA